jgi:hypothetical protein
MLKRLLLHTDRHHEVFSFPMIVSLRKLAMVLASTLLAGALSGCASLNEKASSAMGAYIPQWAGGLPPDAPPRPGTPEYDAYMKERERLRMIPADQRPQPQSGQSTPSGLDPVH